MSEVLERFAHFGCGPKAIRRQKESLGQKADFFIAGLVYSDQNKPAAVQPAVPFHQCLLSLTVMGIMVAV